MVARAAENHPRAVTPDDIVAAARSLLGKPYLHQGRGPNRMDCAGVALQVASRFDLMPDADLTADYGRLPGPALVATMRRLCRKIEEPRRGCLILIRWHGTAFAQHMAICAGDTLIHCCGLQKRVIEHGYRGHWIKQTDSAWWIPGVCEA